MAKYAEAQLADSVGLDRYHQLLRQVFAHAWSSLSAPDALATADLDDLQSTLVCFARVAGVTSYLIPKHSHSSDLSKQSALADIAKLYFRCCAALESCATVLASRGIAPSSARHRVREVRLSEDAIRVFGKAARSVMDGRNDFCAALASPLAETSVPSRGSQGSHVEVCAVVIPAESFSAQSSRPVDHRKLLNLMQLKKLAHVGWIFAAGLFSHQVSLLASEQLLIAESFAIVVDLTAAAQPNYKPSLWHLENYEKALEFLALSEEARARSTCELLEPASHVRITRPTAQSEVKVRFSQLTQTRTSTNL